MLHYFKALGILIFIILIYLYRVLILRVRINAIITILATDKNTSIFVLKYSTPRPDFREFYGLLISFTSFIIELSLLWFISEIIKS